MLKRFMIAAFSLAVASATLPSLAAEKIVALSVPSMYCAACPITVSRALEKVPGVQKVKATFEPNEAVVTFDDAKTSVEQLMRATTNAGFPSTLKKQP